MNYFTNYNFLRETKTNYKFQGTQTSKKKQTPKKSTKQKKCTKYNRLKNRD
jgi:hypothetical protein